MAVAIRMARHGAKKKPFYRIVVADQRSPRDGRCIEQVGFYDPKGKPVELKLDAERVRYWIDKGARPSETVKWLLKKARDERDEGAGVEASPRAETAPPPPAEPKPEVEESPAPEEE